MTLKEFKIRFEARIEILKQMNKKEPNNLFVTGGLSALQTIMDEFHQVEDALILERK